MSNHAVGHDATAESVQTSPSPPDPALATQDDALADEIQSLLDEAKTQESPAGSRSESGSDAAGDAVAIEQVDQMLADHADQAVGGSGGTPGSMSEATSSGIGDGGGGSFDSVGAVTDPTTEALADARPGEQGGEAREEFSETEGAQGRAEETSGGEPIDPDAFASPEQLLADEAEAPAFDPGAFDAPDEVLGQTPDPDAAEEPVPEPTAALDEDALDADPQPSHARLDAAATIEVASDSLRHLCALVNRPLGRYSPETRNTVGWFALATLVNASALLLYGLIT